MNPPKRPSLYLIVLWFLCTLAALVPVTQRVKLEQSQKTVCPVMCCDDLVRLAEESGIPFADWCSALSDAGLQSVLLTTEQLDDPELIRVIAEAGLSHAQIGGLSRGGVYFFDLRYDETELAPIRPGPPWTKETLPFSEVLRSLRETDSLLVLVEQEAQMGVLLPEGWTEDAYAGRIAKGYWLNRWCSASVGRLGYSGTEETENILFRSVIDRGIQVLWIMPISTEAGEVLTDPVDYAQLLSGLKQRLERFGYHFGLPQGYPDENSSVWLLIPVGTAVLLACLLLLEQLCSLPNRTLWILAGICAVENVLGFLLFRQLQIAAMALVAAICFPCLSVLLLSCRLRKDHASDRTAYDFLSTLLSCVGLTLCGALLISALLSGRDYLLVFRLFRGVKLSQAAVYLFALLVFYLALLRRKGVGLRSELAEMRRKRGGLLSMLLLPTLALFVGAVYLLRTGDHMLDALVVEQRLRNWFEHLLCYRPRTKEFLVAWPALALAFFCVRRDRRGLCWLFSSLSSVGFASVINTFCHSRSHFLASAARTGFGLIFGILLSMALLGLLRILPCAKRKGVKKC